MQALAGGDLIADRSAMPRRALVRTALAAFAAAFVAAGCGLGATTSPTPGAVRAASMQAVLIASQVVVGDQRFPIGILDRNTPVNDARVRVVAYRDAPSDPLRSESDAPFRGDGLGGAGAYVARLKFGAAGRWIAQVTAQLPSGVVAVSSLPFSVSLKARVPAPGNAAPKSRNHTVKDVPDVSYIDSGVPPDDMHDLSIADVVERHRAAIVVFATPALCRSAMCGPEVNAVKALEPAYRDRLTFIHVEIYENFRPDPARMRLSPTVMEWRLESEPWVFLIDREGIIRAAFEGPTATDEIREAVDRMLASG